MPDQAKQAASLECHLLAVEHAQVPMLNTPLVAHLAAFENDGTPVRVCSSLQCHTLMLVFLDQAATVT